MYLELHCRTILSRRLANGCIVQKQQDQTQLPAQLSKSRLMYGLKWTQGLV